MKEYVKSIIIPMVDFPDEVQIDEHKQNEKSIVIIIKTNKNDIGKLIGKKGRNITAIRTLISAVSAKEGKRCTFEVLE